MRKLNLLDLNERGDADFSSLSEVEMGLYVLFLFFTLRDMEGITHFYSHHARHVTRLLAILTAAEAPNARAVTELSEFLREQAGGSWDGEAIEEFFDRMSDEDDARIGEWDREYDFRTEEMWDRVREYTRRRYETDFE